MDSPRSLSRRRLLVGYGAVAALGLLAGCLDSNDSDDASDDSDDGASDSSGSDDDPSDDDSSDDDPSDDDSSDDDPSDDDSSDDDPSDGSDDSSDSDDSDDSDGTLELQEANVVGVAFEAQGGTHQFDVTLHHDDDGEEGYANWWQVERLDGTQLGRRELLHAHSRQPFTRSETIDVPADVDCVVVRGHDQTHGYGGQAAVVALDSAATNIVDQGTESESFDAGDCPD